MEHFKAITITKIEEGLIDVPQLPERAILDQGLYIMLFDDPIKVGVFGEGVASNSKSRFDSYRSAGKNLTSILNGTKNYSNGSIKTMKVLNEKLLPGESVDVYFKPLPPRRVLEDGYTYKVDLYIEEDKLKNKYKDTLWLS